VLDYRLPVNDRNFSRRFIAVQGRKIAEKLDTAGDTVSLLSLGNGSTANRRMSLRPSEVGPIFPERSSLTELN
jgi:hypothetical protein